MGYLNFGETEFAIFSKNDPGNVDSASQDYQKFLHLHQNYVEKNAIQKKQEPPN